jgi:predicted RNA-binding protein (virulence factor B family)
MREAGADSHSDSARHRPDRCDHVSQSARVTLIVLQMASIGRRNTLRVLRDTPPGLYLDAEELGEVLLPGRYIPEGTEPGADLDVFLYHDSEDRLVATTEVPHAMVGDFALLRVISANRKVGAFLDWGLSKDLLLPMREQEVPVRVGQWVVAYVFVDERSGRIVASTKLKRFLNRSEATYKQGQAVTLLIAGRTPMGYKAIVENAHVGLLYGEETSADLEVGQTVTGYVRTVRPDGKIDLRLDRSGYKRVAPLTKQILEALQANNGQLSLSDDSSPAAIRAAFGTSKKAFKQALGALLREKRIEFVQDGIRLVG